jgi:uncharacterized membrane protein
MVKETPKRRSWLIILLLASLGLNVFLGGLMLGRWFSGPPMMRHLALYGERGSGGDSPGRVILDRMAASLASEHRPAFEAAIARHRDRITQAAAQAREARSQVREALSKEPFDRAALDRAFESVRSSNTALQAATQDAIADAADSLPPEARQRLADWRAYSRGRQ